MEIFLLSLFGGVIAAFVIGAILLKTLVNKAVKSELHQYQQRLSEQLVQELEDFKEEMRGTIQQARDKPQRAEENIPSPVKDIIKTFLEFDAESGKQYVLMMNDVANDSTGEIKEHALEQQITINKLIAALEKKKKLFAPAIVRQIGEIEKRLRRRYEELMELKATDQSKLRKLASAKVEKFDQENKAFNKKLRQLFRIKSNKR